MKKIFIFFIFVVVFMCPSFVFGEKINYLEFKNYKLNIENPEYYDFDNVFKVSDGYLITSRANIFKPSLLKIDFEGNVVWNYVGEWFSAYPQDFFEKKDAYFAAGFCGDPTFACVMKYSKDGELLWKKQVGTTMPNFNESFVFIQDMGDGFVAVGHIGDINLPDSIEKGSNDVVIFKYDYDGNILWQKIYGGSGSEAFNSFIKTSDGGYLGAGTTTSTDIEGLTFNYDTVSILVKFDSNFNVIWQKSFDSSVLGSFSRIKEDSQGDYILIGGTSSISLVSKIDENGNVLWSNKLDGRGSYYFSDVEEINDRYLFVGATASNGLGMDIVSTIDSFIAEIDMETGEVLGLNNYPGSLQEKYSALVPLENGEFLMFGSYSELFTSNIQDITPIYLSILKVSYEHFVIKNDFYNGKCDVLVKNDIGTVECTPDPGFRTLKVVVKKKNGEYASVSSGGDKYQFKLDDDAYLNVYFEKINDNEDYSLFKKSWSYDTFYKNDYNFKDYDLLTFMTALENGNIVTSRNNVNENVISSEISILNTTGKELKRIKLDNTTIIGLVAVDNYLYVYGCTDYLGDRSLFLQKYDYDLNKTNEITIDRSYNYLQEHLEFSVLYNMDLCKHFDNKLYLPHDSGVLIYDYDLNLLEEQNMNNELCSIYEHYCLYMNGLDEMNVFGFDSNNLYKVYSGLVYKNSKFQSMLKVMDNNSKEVFSKQLDKYECIISVVIKGDYIIGIGSYDIDMVQSEIFVMDMKGNIVQTINDGARYFKIMNTKNGFVTMSIDYVDSSFTNCSNDSVCLKSSKTYYVIPSAIKIVDDDNSLLLDSLNKLPGEMVNVDVNHKFGYTFMGLKITDADGNVTIVDGNSFIMPDVDVQIEPIFNPIINPNTGSFVSFVLLLLLGVISMLIYKNVKKHEPMLKI